MIFRVIVKQGSTNGGYFYWPMTQGDLTLQEGSTSDGMWFTGPASKSCSDICLDNNQGCNGGIIPTVDIYDTFKSQVHISNFATDGIDSNLNAFIWVCSEKALETFR